MLDRAAGESLLARLDEFAAELGAGSFRESRDEAGIEQCATSPAERRRGEVSLIGPAKKSGANPDNRYRHRQAYGKGTDKRRCECGKLVYLRLHPIEFFRHGSSSTAREV